MTGEEVLNLARRLSNDHGTGSWHHVNSALRRYCRETGFAWLRAVDDAALTFLSGVTEYALADLGLRRISRVWVQDSDSSRWILLEEADPLAFEEIVRLARDDNGNDEDDRPTHWKLEGSFVTVAPTPDQSYNGRITGIVDTPAVERTKELPGPVEYHDVVARLAASYQIQANALTIIEGADSDIAIAKSQSLMGIARQFEQSALADLRAFVVRDSQPNRMSHLQWKKWPITR